MTPAILPSTIKESRLPVSTRNWWVGLTMLHTLFTREHNAICDRLKVDVPGLGRCPACSTWPA